jgi:hypothetical protein
MYVGVDLGGHKPACGHCRGGRADRRRANGAHAVARRPARRPDADGSVGPRLGRSRGPAPGCLRRGRAGLVGPGNRHDQVPAESAYQLDRRAHAGDAGCASRLSGVPVERCANGHIGRADVRTRAASQHDGFLCHRHRDWRRRGGRWQTAAGTAGRRGRIGASDHPAGRPALWLRQPRLSGSACQCLGHRRRRRAIAAQRPNASATRGG